MKRWMIWLAAGVVGVVVLVVGGTFAYLNFIKSDAPEALTFENRDAATTTVAPTTTTPTAPTTGADAGATTTSASSGAASDGIDGTWSATTASELGYRVKEVLFGQSTEGVGRTNQVTGDLTITGTKIEDGAFTVDMTTVESDSGQRDNQFRNRIMETGTYPTATFILTEPIDLGTVPTDKEEITVTATGDLTLKDTTKSVSVELTARRNGASIEVNGTIPIVFADWGIDNPSFGPAQTEDNGVLEFLLVFEQA